MIKRIIKKLAGKIGIEVRKTKPVRKVKTMSLSNPLYVEFVGVSGVGKSTLFNHLKENQKRNWLDLREYMNSLGEVWGNNMLDESLAYQKLAEHKLQMVINNDYNSIDKLRVLQFFYSILINDSLISLYNKNMTVVAEEGLFHNFGDGIENVYTSDLGEPFDSLIKNRAIVYCHASPEIIARRIIKRKNERNVVLPQHKGSSFDELVANQRHTLEEKQRFVSILTENSVPVLMIDTSDDITENTEKVNAFIGSLQQQRI